MLERTGGRATSVIGYVLERFPPQSYGVALLTMFGCTYLLHARLGDAPRWTAVTGAATFLILFLLLRLVDDFDDAAVDEQTPVVSARRRALGGGFVAALALAMLLNAGRPPALLLVGLVAVTAVAAPLAARSRFPRAVLALIYESCPALILVYVHVLWAASGGSPLPRSPVVAMSVLLWAVYEYWKFTRKIGTRAFQPYGLSWRTAWLTGFALILVMGGCMVVLYAGSGVSAAALAVELGVCAAFAAWMVREPPAARVRDGHPLPGWRGLWLPLTVQAGLLLDAAVALGRHGG